LLVVVKLAVPRTRFVHIPRGSGSKVLRARFTCTMAESRALCGTCDNEHDGVGRYLSRPACTVPPGFRDRLDSLACHERSRLVVARLLR
jgi:hypothetical protein